MADVTCSECAIQGIPDGTCLICELQRDHARLLEAAREVVRLVHEGEIIIAWRAEPAIRKLAEALPPTTDSSGSASESPR